MKLRKWLNRIMLIFLAPVMIAMFTLGWCLFWIGLHRDNTRLLVTGDRCISRLQFSATKGEGFNSTKLKGEKE
jgi:hypothetical protein